MIDLEGITKWLATMTIAIGAITGLIIAVKRFWKEIKPFWDNIVKPVLKFVAIALTLILPNGIIVWYFIFRIAEDWAPIISNSDVFLPVVAWLTISVSVYSLFWGMWLYPTILRSFLQSVQLPNAAKPNQPIDNQERGTL